MRVCMKRHRNIQMRVNGTCGGLISDYSQLHNCNIWQRCCEANYLLFLAQTQFSKVLLKSSVENKNITIESKKGAHSRVCAKNKSKNWSRIQDCLTWSDKCKDSILEGC